MFIYKRDKMKRKIIALIVIMLAFVVGAKSRQASVIEKLSLSKIEFVGLQRYSQSDAIAASGLQIGQEINAEALKVAAQKLSDAGLFNKVSYRYQFADGQMEVTFQVEEVLGAIACIFDNFVWFSNEEIYSAIRLVLPSFDGTAPKTGGAVNSITGALEKLLQQRSIKANVEYEPYVNTSSQKLEHLFSVKGFNIPICNLNFSGTAAVKESELLNSSKPLFNSEYSNKGVALFVEENLVPVYQRRGHLQIKFLNQVAKLESNSKNCKDGVSVSLTVNEGLAYFWDKAEWNGNSSFSTKELEESLGMKTGELADGEKIDSSLKAAKMMYANKGYLEAKLSPNPNFEDASRRVSFSVSVNEGPQYRMGQIILTGLKEKDSEQLKEKWQLKQGDIYNASYLGEYLKKTLTGRKIGSGSKSVDIETSINPDRQRHIVDVKITIN
jgi:outer membrane protein assembly factor BamA